jgi:hypothetical protein
MTTGQSPTRYVQSLVQVRGMASLACGRACVARDLSGKTIVHSVPKFLLEVGDLPKDRISLDIHLFRLFRLLRL